MVCWDPIYAECLDVPINEGSGKFELSELPKGRFYVTCGLDSIPEQGYDYVVESTDFNVI